MKKWYKITAKKNNRAKILIYEQIGEDYWGDGVGARQFVKDLDALDVNDIDLHINSPGGSVFEGTSIHNALRAHPAAVHVTIDGIAASIASVIAMAGDDVAMPGNAMMMIHDPSGLVVGTAGDMRKMADALEKVKGGMVAAYQLRADLTDEEVADMMSEETWLTAQDALDYGFADTIIDPVKLQANFQALADFRNVPEQLLKPRAAHTPAPKNKQPKPQRSEVKTMKITLELIQNEHPDIVEAILKSATTEQLQALQPQLVSGLQAAARSEAAAAETARVQAVKEQLIPGHEALVEQLMFDGQTTAEQAAVKILAAEKQARAASLADQADDAPDPLQQPAPGDDNPDDKLPLEARCEARWKKSAELQAEFGNDYDSYLAFEKAVENGQVRVLNHR